MFGSILVLSCVLCYTSSREEDEEEEGGSEWT